ncbi:hypothetical protein K9M48_02375 [Candidatus Gracilibacteria bacterium]|nr:hypothetical protein [Candidatus Gracilibacteria bacterium]
MLKNLLHKASQKLNKMDNAVNGPDPRFVSLQESGKDIKEFVSFDVSDKYCHNYIGKMRKDGEGIYNDEVITALLSFFMKNISKDQTFTIELANIVSEILNDNDNKEQYYSYEEQKKHIINIAKKLNKKGSKKLLIIDIQDRNPELFEALKDNGIAALNNKSKKPTLNLDNFNSLDIAQYLYRATKKNPEYFDDLKKLKPAHLQNVNGNTDYYGLIELAIRINDLLHGIIVQGGVARQKKYDALLLRHINPNDPGYPVLKDLKIFCANVLDKQGEEIPYGNKFRGLYFDTEKSEMLVQKIQEKEKIRSKIRGTTSIISALLIGVLGTNQVMQYSQSKKLKEQTQETIKEIFENKKAYRSGDMGGGEYLGDEKIEAINSYVENLYNRFIFRYGGIGKFTETEFKSKIIDCLNDQKVLDLLGQYRGGDNMVTEDKVIDEYLIPRNIGEFKTSGVDVVPYSDYLKYTDAFVNTILLEEDFETNRDETNRINGVRGSTYNFKLADEIGSYSPKYQGMYGSVTYVHQLAQVKIGGKYYIAATGTYRGDFKKSENYELYSSRGREFAIDFLKQTYPIINELLDQYLLRYYKRYSNSGDLNGLYKNKMPGDIEMILLKDFLSKGLLKKINKNQTDKIITYLDEFAIQNQDTLKKLQSEIMPNLIPTNASLIPNGILEPYEEAMKNSIKDKEDIISDNARLPVSRWKDGEKSVSQLGKYRAQDGKIYLIGKVKINGKEYLYAEEEGRVYRDQNEYGIYYGEIVAKDYFKTKSDFLQKKLIYEKKLKSASQRHDNRPLKNDSIPKK